MVLADVEPEKQNFKTRDDKGKTREVKQKRREREKERKWIKKAVYSSIINPYTTYRSLSLSLLRPKSLRKKLVSNEITSFHDKRSILCAVLRCFFVVAFLASFPSFHVVFCCCLVFLLLVSIYVRSFLVFPFFKNHLFMQDIRFDRSLLSRACLNVL